MRAVSLSPRPQRTLIAYVDGPTRGLPKWSSSEATDENKASLDRRYGDCRACAFRASLGATSQSIGRKRYGSTRPQSRWAWSDALQRGRPAPDGCSSHIGDATDEPPCARPPCGEHSRDAPCPWPQVGDGYHRTAEPSRARPPAGGCSPDGSADGAATTDARPATVTRLRASSSA